MKINFSKDWKQDFKEALKSYNEVAHFFNIENLDLPYDIFIPRPFANIILKEGLDSPLAKQFLPHTDEALPGGLYDPIGDKDNSPTPGLVHRYENRVLFFPTQNCPIICRYCFRKNELSNNDEVFKTNLEKAIEYIKNNPQINEVILSGGDPLMISDEKLLLIANSFAAIKHIKFFRIHTRTPIILPNRVNDDLIKVLKEISNLFEQFTFSLHCNHESEFYDEVLQAIEKIKNVNCHLLSQSVLLKGVNDSTEKLYQLFLKLAQIGVIPYYLHHPDQVKGAHHYGLSIEEGRKIFAPLRNKLPNWAVPQYTLDIPGGAGKVNAFNPESFNFSGQFINKGLAYSSYLKN